MSSDQAPQTDREDLLAVIRSAEASFRCGANSPTARPETRAECLRRANRMAEVPRLLMPVAQPTDFVLAPREPTEAMKDAGARAKVVGAWSGDIYRAMITAAPPAPDVVRELAEALRPFAAERENWGPAATPEHHPLVVEEGHTSGRYYGSPAAYSISDLDRAKAALAAAAPYREPTS